MTTIVIAGKDDPERWVAALRFRAGDVLARLAPAQVSVEVTGPDHALLLDLAGELTWPGSCTSTPARRSTLRRR